MRTRIGVIVGLALTVSVMPLFAHHTISAPYDIDNVVTLKGIVSQVQWQNPHVVLHIDAKNDDGSIVEWNVETLAARALMRRGLGRDFIKAGDAVSMSVFVSKNGTHSAAAQSIALPAGTAYVSMLPGQLR